VKRTRLSGSGPIIEDPEIVLALVAPVGTDLEHFAKLLQRTLERFGYFANQLSLSKLAGNFGVSPPEGEGSSEFRRIDRLMRTGNTLRFQAERGDFLALVAAKSIRAQRGRDRVRAKTAHVLRSLKHPDEVSTLRRIYGPGLYLLGITGSEEQRRGVLRKKGCSASEIETLFERDEYEENNEFIAEGKNYGQRVRDTFQLADAFVGLDDEDEIFRFLGLVFGHPFTTPERDEYAMFLAYSASLRSADLSRQVGAVVMSEFGDIVGIGANDVPRFGGGLYWPGEDDHRDFVRGEDSNEVRRDQILEDALTRLAEPLPAGQRAQWIAEGHRALSASLLKDITEYGRAVHAEMESLLSCARSGVSTRGATLYSTTFPCHNCAKHIVAAGVRRVVYIEPYAKSQTKELFGDSVHLGSGTAPRGRVQFEPFNGVGPRKFFDLFSMRLSSGTSLERKRNGRALEWVPQRGVVRVPLVPNSYLELERLAQDELLKLTSDPRKR
jgi:deoxycytidylate deaminase